MSKDKKLDDFKKYINTPLKTEKKPDFHDEAWSKNKKYNATKGNFVKIKKKF